MARLISRSDCIACGECQRRCPKDAIRAASNYYYILEDQCIECDICFETCPEGAVGFSENRIGKKKAEKVPKGWSVHIDPEKCISCGLCADHCPKKAIDGEKPPYNYELRDVTAPVPFSVDPDKCIRCGICSSWCRIGAVYYEE